MMMSRRSGSSIVVEALIFLGLLLLQLQCGAANTVHVVGNSTGWIIPTSDSFYSSWASGKTFQVGDVLTFNFETGRHDVVIVPKESYDKCSTDKSTGTYQTGPTNITLNNTGENYYICSFGNHCNNGQKLAVKVTSMGPMPSPSPTSPVVPPPPSSSAATVYATSFLVVLSVVIGMAF